METGVFCGVCSFSQISWLWYGISVVAAFMVGALWYAVLFQKPWIKAVDYTCRCGANLSKGEKCTCNQNGASGAMILQFIATAIVGLLYFIVAPMSVKLAGAIAVAMAVWMIGSLKFRTADSWKFRTLVGIDVGYFLVVSLIFTLFALI